MSEEMMRILKMLEQGKISADEASTLIDALGRAEGAPAGGSGKMLRVVVYKDDKEKPSVNVNIPIELIKFGLQFIPEEHRSRIEEKGVDFSQIAEMIEAGAQGKLVEVEDDGKRVIVSVE